MQTWDLKQCLQREQNIYSGWRSPDFLYCNAINPRLKVLLRNFQMSDDIAFRFGNQGWSEWPLTADKFAGWINDKGDEAEIDKPVY